MMNKKQTSYRSIWKYALILPVLAILLFFNSALQMKAEPGNEMNTVQQAPAKTQVKPVATIQQAPPQKAQNNPVTKNGKQIYSHVEVMPSFPGGTEALLKWLGANIQYPKEAQEKGIQGRVILRFIVTSDGSVKDVEVVKGLDPVCDQEAVRVVKLMPKWIPGKQNGKEVDVYYSLPVTFKLEGSPPISDKQVNNDVIIEIDGKVAARGELQKLDPKTIESMDVLKNPNRIIIKTKKNK